MVKKAISLLLTAVVFISTGIARSVEAQSQELEYVYRSACVPTQAEDIARVIQGAIYLALRADPTVADKVIKVKVKKLPVAKQWITQTQFLGGLGFAFNTSDLAIAVGGAADAHSCLTEATLTISMSVTRKDGTKQTNEFSTVIQIPGVYATQTKVRSDQFTGIP